ncbi:MAG: ice-binding family protein [Elusimicrobiota bacterium]
MILSKSGISTIPTSAITGNIGVSPIAAIGITGFSEAMDVSNQFSIATQVTGRIYAADYAVPTPANLTTAVSNMETAYTNAAGRAADFTEIGAGNIGGMTLPAGTYKWGTSLLIPTDVTLSGGPNDVWIFQISGDLTIAAAKNVILSGGALPKNIFWQAFGAVSLDTTAHFEGVILSQTAITLNTGATINGRLLSQTAVTLDSNTVVQPAP